MSKTFGINLTSTQIVKICHDLNVRESDLSKVMKDTLTDQKNSKYFNQRLAIEQKITKSDEDIIKESPEEKLRKILGIDKGDVKLSRKIKASGIYFKQNVENDLGLFVQYWEGNWQRVDEICVLLQNHKMKELAVRELVQRMKNK